MRAFLSTLLVFGFVSCSLGGRAEKPFNELCPVMGQKVNPKVKTISYAGKAYGFCCGGCDKKFAADPAKYAANLSEDGKVFLGQKSSSTH